MPRHRPFDLLATRTCRLLGAGLLCLMPMLCHAEEALPDTAGDGPKAVPQAEGSRWAEIRRMLAPTGDGYLPTGSGERRIRSREELHRLREDIRANRDIYEVRERRGRPSR